MQVARRTARRHRLAANIAAGCRVGWQEFPAACRGWVGSAVVRVPRQPQPQAQPVLAGPAAGSKAHAAVGDDRDGRGDAHAQCLADRAIGIVDHREGEPVPAHGGVHLRIVAGLHGHRHHAVAAAVQAFDGRRGVPTVAAPFRPHVKHGRLALRLEVHRRALGGGEAGRCHRARIRCAIPVQRGNQGQQQQQVDAQAAQARGPTALGWGRGGHGPQYRRTLRPGATASARPWSWPPASEAPGGAQQACGRVGVVAPALASKPNHSHVSALDRAFPFRRP